MLAAERPRELVLPILVRLEDLAHHASKTESLDETIDKLLASNGETEELRSFVREQLKLGRTALLFDAWDEVGEARQSALHQQVSAWARKYAGPMILTSRPAKFGRSPLGEAPVVEMMAFEHNEIEMFSETWARV
jgi:predicted NACHT family NTPase